MQYVQAQQASDFLQSLSDESVDLFCIDPPYYKIVKDSWDNQWRSESHYVDWLVDLFVLARKKVHPKGSLMMFHCVGRHGEHPLFKIIEEAEKHWNYRNLITWGKRRGYGKEYDYLFCREEIVWFSSSEERTEVTFNIPLLNVKRGYAGFNPKYPAKSEFKRVTNVWTDIPELMRPERNTQKPVELLDRIIQTHSNPGQLVVDFFSGYGTTGISAVKNTRRFLGCEAIEADAIKANDRIVAISNSLKV